MAKAKDRDYHAFQTAAGQQSDLMLKLLRRRDELGVTPEEFHALFTDAGESHIDRMLLGLKVPAAGVVDMIICVDRSIRPTYPDFTKTVIHPELETTGLAEYDFSHAELWLHEDQGYGQRIEGYRIYEYLKDNKMLGRCFSLRDGEEIQKKGPVAFRRFFGGKFVFLWKSVVQSRDSHLWAPYLSECAEQVFIDWRRLDAYFDSSCQTAHFANWRFA